MGKDTLITWGTGDSLLLEGVKPKNLSASDFEFEAVALTTLSSVSGNWNPEAEWSARSTSADLLLL